MAVQGSSPRLQDMYALAEQLEADRDLPLAELRRRDRQIGAACVAEDDTGRLLHWLGQLRQSQAAPAPENRAETTAVALRATALLLGGFAMAGFLLASPQALVNVLLFLLVFVLLPFLASLLAVVTLTAFLRGRPAAVSPLNPARMMLRRGLAQAGYGREISGAARLLLLRYGQELALLFTLGAMLVFTGLASVTGFGFVWGSTFALGAEWMLQVTEALAAPWRGWLPAQSLSADVVAGTRYYASGADAAALTEASRSAWWWFLFMCMGCYALSPRLLLWQVSKTLYRREIQRAFAATPGAAAVLARMRAPQVDTRAPEQERVVTAAEVEIDEGLMLLNWAQAVSAKDIAALPFLARVPSANRLQAGFSTPDEDAAAVAAINAYRPELILVVVKAWEPPMADLADVLGQLGAGSRCVLCLAPLKGRALTAQELDQWQAFAGELDPARVRCEALEWCGDDGD